MTLVEIDTPAKRARLQPRKNPYWVGISGGRGGVSLGYRRSMTGAGVWIAKTIAFGGRAEERIGGADDAPPAADAIGYKTAVARALEWSTRQQEILETSAENERKAAVPTVGAALESYILVRESRSEDDGANSRARLKKHVLSQSEFCRTKFAKLRATSIEDLVGELVRSSGLAASSINRLLNDLRAALNAAATKHRRQLPAHIFQEIKFGTKALEASTQARRQLLTDAQISALVEAAFEVDDSGDFGRLVLTLAATGARHSQTRKATVSALQTPLSRIMMPGSVKGRTQRVKPPVAIPLSDDVIARLAPATQGRAAEETLLERWSYRRTGKGTWGRDTRRAWGWAHEAGFNGGWQLNTGAWVVGNNVELHDIVATNFYSGFCWRGPVVAAATSPTGYDHRVQATGFKSRNFKVDLCDFHHTGSSMKGPIVEYPAMTNPTHYTVPPHMIYLQSPTASRIAITSIADNGAGLCRITTNAAHGLVSASNNNKSMTAAEILGTTEANGEFIATYVSATTLDLVGSAYVNAYVSGGYIGPTHEGFVDGPVYRSPKIAGFPYSDAMKLSNCRDGLIDAPEMADNPFGNLTLSYAWRCKVVNPDIREIGHGSYGVRQTDDFGDDNQVVGGSFTGKSGAHFAAVTNFGAGRRLLGKGCVAISNFPTIFSSTIRTFNNATGGSAIFDGCVDIQLQSNLGFSYGNGASGGELTVSNPLQRGRRGVLRAGAGTINYLTMTPAMVDTWDAASVLSLTNSGTLTLTTHPTLDGNNTFKGNNAFAGDATFTGTVLSSGALKGVGYGTGAGGTQTQGTSKATTVVLNKVCGEITTHAASLNAATTVSFTLTNSAIGAGDVIVVSHASGGTIGAYTLNARAGAGSATVDITNRSAGALGEAIVIRFAVIKAVTA